MRDRLARFIEDFTHGTTAPLKHPCLESEELAEAILDEFTVTERVAHMDGCWDRCGRFPCRCTCHHTKHLSASAGDQK